MMMKGAQKWKIKLSSILFVTYHYVSIRYYVPFEFQNILTTSNAAFSYYFNKRTFQFLTVFVIVFLKIIKQKV